MNLSKYQMEFLRLMEDNPLQIFNALSEIDVMKPLIWKDLIKNGGKLGYRGIARKYGITDNQARRIISNIDNNVKNG